MAAAPTSAPAAAAAGTAPAGAPAKNDVAPILQQLSLTALRTRMHDLQSTISRILHTFHTNPSSNWAEVLAQFSIVNVELLSLVEDIKPVLKAFVVYPKNVNATTAPILPIMLSSKLLPELEAEEAALKEQVLAPLSNLTHHAQTEKLQKQIETLRNVCDVAEKAISEARKTFGFGARQGLLSVVANMDKVQLARIHEQEKLLLAAANFGEGLRISSDQRGAPAALPPHMASALASGDQGADGTSYSRTAQASLRPTTPQHVAAPAPSQTPLAYAANSPRPVNFNDTQPQQQGVMQRAPAKSHIQKQLMNLRPGSIPQMQNVGQQAMQQPLLQQPKLQQFPQTQIQHQLQQQQHAQLQHHLQLQQFQQLHQQQHQLQGNRSQMGNLPAPMLPQGMVPPGMNMQQRLQFGMQSQRSQMLADPPLYMQSPAGLPMQQQLPGQPGNYGLMSASGNLLNSTNLLASNQGNLFNQGNLLNTNGMTFGQPRGPPPQ